MTAAPVPHPLFLLPEDRFAPVPQARTLGASAHRPDTPVLLKGIASHWPATRSWSFEHLARLGGSQPVRLVQGNREGGRTRFIESALDDYLMSLHRDAGPGAGEPALYLKEFDLLRRMPSLADDLPARGLFPRHCIVSTSAWIGPRGAHTGLHRDHLDNLAVLLRGRKRFFIARPGTVEALGATSRKYDRWARLSAIGMAELCAQLLPEGSLYAVDLHPGDALYVPHGWWHEVVNAQPSIFMSGFFGRSRVIGQWLSTGLQQVLHDTVAQLLPTECTCHSHR